MDIHPLFKSIIDQDTAAVVICDMACTIVYMNPASVRRYKRSLVGQSLRDCHNADSNQKIDRVLAWFQASVDNNILFTYHNGKENKDVYMVALRDEAQRLIGFYEKHEYRNADTRQPYEGMP